MTGHPDQLAPTVTGSSTPIADKNAPTLSEIRSSLLALKPMESMTRCASLLFDGPNRVAELRVLNAWTGRRQMTKSGYFDSAEKITTAAASVDGKCSGVYATMNPAMSAVFARSANRLKDYPKETTSDRDIASRRMLLIDLDPKRPSGISSTDGELAAAWQLADSILEFLREKGLPMPCVAMSGNGVHLIYRVDLPCDDAGLVESFLNALALRFNTDAVQVDESVYNPARLLKFYGTMACKGSNTPDRPHRRSALWVPEGGPQVVTKALIEAVANTAARAISTAQRNPAKGEAAFDVSGFLSRSGVEVSRHGPWSGGTRWALKACPFDPQHIGGSAYVVQFTNGAIAAGCHHNSCAHWGWSELRAHLDPGWQQHKATSAGSVGDGGGHAGTIWGEPEPIRDELLPVPVVPRDDLPDELRDWLVDISDRIGCPLDFVVVGALVGLSSIVGNKVGILPKRQDDWTVVPNLWGAIIGRPGVMKSPALSQVLQPLVAIEREKQLDYGHRLLAHEAALIAWETKRKRLGSRGKPTNSEIDQFALELMKEKPVPPPCPRRVVNDCTIEKLVDILRDNPSGLLLFRDELVGLLRGLDKEGRETDRSFYLESWTGTGSFTLDRVIRGTVAVPELCLSILGGIQPGPLLEYMRQSARSGAGDDGFVQRFQLVAWPDLTEWRNVDRQSDERAFHAAMAVYHRLDRLDATALKSVTNLETEGTRPVLRFSEEAQDLFDSWRADLEKRLRAEQDVEALESHLAKFRSLAPSLALLFYLVDGGSDAVDARSLKRALSFVAYFEAHARRIYGAASKPSARVARLLSSKIRGGKLKSPFTARDVYTSGWSGLTDTDEVNKATGHLEELGWLRSERVGAGGRPSLKFHINPACLKLKAGGQASSVPDIAPTSGPLAVPCATGDQAHPSNPSSITEAVA